MSDKSHRNVGGGAHYDACPRWKERDCDFEDGECVCDDFDGIIAAAVAAAEQRVTSDFAKYLRHMVDDDKFAAGVKAAREAVAAQAAEFLADDDRVGHSVMQYALAAIDGISDEGRNTG